MKPYLIDAILGNSRMLATLTGDGEIQRLFWPHVDGGQHIHRLLGGVSLDGGPVIWQNADAWSCSQSYEADQNILLTTARLASGLAVVYRDGATLGRDLLVRQITFTNEGDAPVGVKFVLFQWVRVDENPLYNTALYDKASDSLISYRRDTYLATGADRPLARYHVSDGEHGFAQASHLEFPGKQIGQGDVSIAGLWDLGLLEPGQAVSLTLLHAWGRSPSEVRALLAAGREEGAGRLFASIRAYWTDFLARARPVKALLRESAPAARPGLPAAAKPEEVEALYRRSLLVFKLMQDEQTGAVIAAPEFDPRFTACGGYAYCWGRDAAFITTAMDYAGYHEMAARFYQWALSTQEEEGWWMHRHYASGHWGPSWGLLQVDETGAILYGMGVHAKLYGGAAFAAKVWPAVQKAADWLIATMDPETGLPVTSVDLWEERTAQHTYSCAAVYGGLRAAADLAEMVGEGLRAEGYRAAAQELQGAILREAVRDGRFLRSRKLEVQVPGSGELQVVVQEEDPTPDSSLLGLCSPFRVVEPDDPVMVRTADWLWETIWSQPGGGMLRYTNDHYRGGRNPWVLCTLWMGLYEAERGNRLLAEQILDWAVARRTRTGLLPEQVDPVTGGPAWVVPLTWSHAMYVLLALELYGA